MAEDGPFGISNKMLNLLLSGIGIILIVAGVAVATIHSSLRGSGLGTALLVIGVVLLIVGLYRFTQKGAK